MKSLLYENELKELLDSGNLVLADFFAEWCEPCAWLYPTFDEIEKIFGEHLSILKIDIDKFPGLARFYEVRSVPTLLLFHEQQIRWRYSGVPETRTLKAEVRKLLG